MMTHYGEEDEQGERRMRSQRCGSLSGRALTRSPFLLCCKTRLSTNRSRAMNPHLLYLLSRELLGFLGHYDSVVVRSRRPP